MGPGPMRPGPRASPGECPFLPLLFNLMSVSAPSVATANVPAGTVQSYNQYQSTINSVVLASAEAAAATVSGQTGAARRSNNGVTGWAAMGVGAVGAAVGVLVL